MACLRLPRARYTGARGDRPRRDPRAGASRPYPRDAGLLCAIPAFGDLIPSKSRRAPASADHLFFLYRFIRCVCCLTSGLLPALITTSFGEPGSGSESTMSRESLGRLEQFIEIADRFESAWRQGLRPRIEDFL